MVGKPSTPETPNVTPRAMTNMKTACVNKEYRKLLQALLYASWCTKGESHVRADMGWSELSPNAMTIHRMHISSKITDGGELAILGRKAILAGFESFGKLWCRENNVYLHEDDKVHFAVSVLFTQRGADEQSKGQCHARANSPVTNQRLPRSLCLNASLL